MRRLLSRIVAVILVTALVADPTFAAITQPMPVPATQSSSHAFNSQALTLTLAVSSYYGMTHLSSFVQFFQHYKELLLLGVGSLTAILQDGSHPDDLATLWQHLTALNHSIKEETDFLKKALLVRQRNELQESLSYHGVVRNAQAAPKPDASLDYLDPLSRQGARIVARNNADDIAIRKAIDNQFKPRPQPNNPSGQGSARTTDLEIAKDKERSYSSRFPVLPHEPLGVRTAWSKSIHRLFFVPDHDPVPPDPAYQTATSSLLELVNARDFDVREDINSQPNGVSRVWHKGAYTFWYDWHAGTIFKIILHIKRFDNYPFSEAEQQAFHALQIRLENEQDANEGINANFSLSAQMDNAYTAFISIPNPSFRLRLRLMPRETHIPRQPIPNRIPSTQDHTIVSFHTIRNAFMHRTLKQLSEEEDGQPFRLPKIPNTLRLEEILERHEPVLGVHKSQLDEALTAKAFIESIARASLQKEVIAEIPTDLGQSVAAMLGVYRGHLPAHVFKLPPHSLEAFLGIEIERDIPTPTCQMFVENDILKIVSWSGSDEKPELPAPRSAMDLIKADYSTLMTFLGGIVWEEQRSIQIQVSAGAYEQTFWLKRPQVNPGWGTELREIETRWRVREQFLDQINFRQIGVRPIAGVFSVFQPKQGPLLLTIQKPARPGGKSKISTGGERHRFVPGSFIDGTSLDGLHQTVRADVAQDLLSGSRESVRYTPSGQSPLDRRSPFGKGRLADFMSRDEQHANEVELAMDKWREADEAYRAASRKYKSIVRAKRLYSSQDIDHAKLRLGHAVLDLDAARDEAENLADQFSTPKRTRKRAKLLKFSIGLALLTAAAASVWSGHPEILFMGAFIMAAMGRGGSKPTPEPSKLSDLPPSVVQSLREMANKFLDQTTPLLTRIEALPWDNPDADTRNELDALLKEFDTLLPKQENRDPIKQLFTTSLADGLGNITFCMQLQLHLHETHAIEANSDIPKIRALRTDLFQRLAVLRTLPDHTPLLTGSLSTIINFGEIAAQYRPEEWRQAGQGETANEERFYLVLGTLFKTHPEGAAFYRMYELRMRDNETRDFVKTYSQADLKNPVYLVTAQTPGNDRIIVGILDAGQNQFDLFNADSGLAIRHWLMTLFRQPHGLATQLLGTRILSATTLPELESGNNVAEILIHLQIRPPTSGGAHPGKNNGPKGGERSRSAGFPIRLDHPFGPRTGPSNIMGPLLSQNNGPDEPAGPPQLPVKRKMLLVDDEHYVFDSLKPYFENLGYEVTPAFNGQEALDQLKTSLEPFDVILTDKQMTLMDGPMLIRELKKMAAHGEHIPPVLMHSWGSHYPIAQALGVRYLDKESSHELYARAVEEEIAKSKSSTPEAGGAHPRGNGGPLGGERSLNFYNMGLDKAIGDPPTVLSRLMKPFFARPEDPGAPAIPSRAAARKGQRNQEPKHISTLVIGRKKQARLELWSGDMTRIPSDAVIVPTIGFSEDYPYKPYGQELGGLFSLDFLFNPTTWPSISGVAKRLSLAEHPNPAGWIKFYIAATHERGLSPTSGSMYIAIRNALSAANADGLASVTLLPVRAPGLSPTLGWTYTVVDACRTYLSRHRGSLRTIKIVAVSNPPATWKNELHFFEVQMRAMDTSNRGASIRSLFHDPYAKLYEGSPPEQRVAVADWDADRLEGFGHYLGALAPHVRYFPILIYQTAEDIAAERSRVLNKLRDAAPDILVISRRLHAQWDGVDLALAARQLFPRLPIGLWSAHSPAKLKQEAIARGVSRERLVTSFRGEGEDLRALIGRLGFGGSNRVTRSQNAQPARIRAAA
jgi:CheY-like chemotaxis protein